MRRIVFAVLGLALTASVASAQTAAGQSYVEGLGGVTFGTDKASGTIGGEYGYGITDQLTVYGNINYAFNVLPGDYADYIASLCIVGGCDPKVSATFITGGVKYYIPTSAGKIHPYAAGGLGVTRLKFSLDNGDVLDDVLDEFDIDRTETKGLFEVGGGIEVPVTSNGKVDVGYRLAKIFEDNTDPVHRVYGGFAWSF